MHGDMTVLFSGVNMAIFLLNGDVNDVLKFETLETTCFSSKESFGYLLTGS